MKATVALVDDHALLRRGLATLVKDLGYQVAFEAGHGKEFIEKLKTHPLPNVVLMDINMPQMDGYETALWLKNNHSSVKVLVLSMLDDEVSLIRMFKNGAHGYILKDCDPQELNTAIESVLQKGIYHSEMIGGKLIRAMHNLDEISASQPAEKVQLSDKETEFLKWACTELSYKEIAGEMGVSPRTVDNYRDSLQEKLECKGRIGLVLWAIKNGVVVV
jgi:two-component system, NarL family, invasion response regulator UvrY